MVEGKKEIRQKKMTQVRVRGEAKKNESVC